MKKTLSIAAIVALVAIVGYLQRGTPRGATARPEGTPTGSSVGAAFASHASEVRVSDQGRVVKILADDNDGSRHQRFILRVDSGPTVLVAHNIDLARRVSPLQVGDLVSFAGEYLWNAKGGVVHWTHRDPSGRREAGWLEHDGETFQ